MKINKTYWTLIFTLLFCNPLSYGKSISTTTLEEVLHVSGLKNQIDLFPATIKTSIDQAKQLRSSMSPRKYAQLKTIVDKTFNSSTFINEISNEINNNLSQSDSEFLLAWYKSQTGAQIIQAEENTVNPSAYHQKIRDSNRLLSDEKRIDYAKQINRLVNGTQFTKQVQKYSAFTLYTALTASQKNDDLQNIDVIRSRISDQLNQQSSNIEKVAIISIMYPLKNFQNLTIEEYIAFLSQPISKTFHDSVLKGITKAFERSVQEMTHSIISLFD